VCVSKCVYVCTQVWNIVSGQCLHKLEGPHCHESAVTSLQFTDRFIVTSSDDGTVKLWDLQTGKFLRNLVELPSGGNGESADRTVECGWVLAVYGSRRHGTDFDSLTHQNLCVLQYVNCTIDILNCRNVCLYAYIISKQPAARRSLLWYTLMVPCSSTCM